MATAQSRVVLRHIRRLAAVPSGDGDRELLGRFVTRRDEAAFEALVKRYGLLVLGVCRRVLHNRDDAEDAFQATFLVLARKAASISNQASLGSWLYKVTYHMAATARKQTTVRQQREGEAPARVEADPLTEIIGRELLALLDEELQMRPERYRAALVHCYLGGQTRDEAAKQLGCSESTVNRRLEQGKQQLHKRLLRRGVDLSAALIALALTQSAVHGALDASLFATTIKAGLSVATRGAIGGIPSARVAALANAASSRAEAKSSSNS